MTDRRAPPVLPNIEVVAVDRWRPWWRREAQGNMFVLGCVFAVLGLSMLLQPGRWADTPAYTNLRQLLPLALWGGAYAIAGVLLLVTVFSFPRQRLTVMPAMVLSTALTGAWGTAFVVRWLGSTNTTPEVFLSFAVFGFLLIRAWVSLDDTQPVTPAR